jgi:glycosyltransferase involved in cell wall biosynthesis
MKSTAHAWDHLRRGSRRLLNRVREPEVSQARIGRYLERTRRRGASLPSPGPRGSVAIVVPCFGHASYLPATFESLMRQTRPPEEAIFVVDGATDDTEGTLRRLIEQPGVSSRASFSVLVNERNMGQAASLNRGIAHATADLVMILNDDDYLMHDAVESMLALFSAHREVVLIGGTSIHFDSDNELSALPKLRAEYGPEGIDAIEIRLPSDVKRYRRYNDLNLTHSASCFTKSAWLAVGGYYADKRARLVPFSDRDFQLRLNALFPVALSPDVPFSFWRRGSSVDNGRNS